MPQMGTFAAGLYLIVKVSAPEARRSAKNAAETAGERLARDRAVRRLRAAREGERGLRTRGSSAG